MNANELRIKAITNNLNEFSWSVLRLLKDRLNLMPHNPSVQDIADVRARLDRMERASLKTLTDIIPILREIERIGYANLDRLPHAERFVLKDQWSAKVSRVWELLGDLI